MKRILLDCAIVLLVVCGMVSCQIVTGAIDVAREVKGFPVVVTLQDGTVVTGEAKLPNGGTKKVTVKGEDGERHKLQAEDILTLTAWNDKAPDMKYAMVFRDKHWLVPEAVGEHLMVFALAVDYFIEKDGDMVLKGEHFSFYGFRPGEETGTLLGTTHFANSNKLARKYLMEYLADDPEMCERIRDKDIEPFDYKRICEEYNPAK